MGYIIQFWIMRIEKYGDSIDRVPAIWKQEVQDYFNDKQNK